VIRVFLAGLAVGVGIMVGVGWVLHRRHRRRAREREESFDRLQEIRDLTRERVDEARQKSRQSRKRLDYLRGWVAGVDYLLGRLADSPSGREPGESPAERAIRESQDLYDE